MNARGRNARVSRLAHRSLCFGAGLRRSSLRNASQAHFSTLRPSQGSSPTLVKKGPAPIGARPFLSKDYKKDIFSILADGVELLHKRLRLLYITFNFKAADKNYLYFLF